MNLVDLDILDSEQVKEDNPFVHITIDGEEIIAIKLDYLYSLPKEEDKIADIETLRSRIIDAVHGTICSFFEPVTDDSEAPMTPFDSRLLTVNKEVCNRIREIFESYSRKEQE